MAYNIKILVVEDIEFDRDLLIQLLQDQYQVIAAKNGAEAIDLAQQIKPDIILMDMSLPIIDGWEATRRIKSNTVLSKTPVIAITAHAMDGDVKKGLVSGCDEYLTKPIDEMRLFNTLQRYLDKER